MNIILNFRVSTQWTPKAPITDRGASSLCATSTIHEALRSSSMHLILTDSDQNFRFCIPKILFFTIFLTSKREWRVAGFLLCTDQEYTTADREHTSFLSQCITSNCLIFPRIPGRLWICKPISWFDMDFDGLEINMDCQSRFDFVIFQIFVNIFNEI